MGRRPVHIHAGEGIGQPIMPGCIDGSKASSLYCATDGGRREFLFMRQVCRGFIAIKRQDKFAKRLSQCCGGWLIKNKPSVWLQDAPDFLQCSREIKEVMGGTIAANAVKSRIGEWQVFNIGGLGMDAALSCEPCTIGRQVNALAGCALPLQPRQKQTRRRSPHPKYAFRVAIATPH